MITPILRDRSLLEEVHTSLPYVKYLLKYRFTAGYAGSAVRDCLFSERVTPEPGIWVCFYRTRSDPCKTLPRTLSRLAKPL